MDKYIPVFHVIKAHAVAIAVPLIPMVGVNSRLSTTFIKILTDVKIILNRWLPVINAMLPTGP
jgi:hypothetical protein